MTGTSSTGEAPDKFVRTYFHSRIVGLAFVLMKIRSAFAVTALFVLPAHVALAKSPRVTDDMIFTNEEQVYFAKEERRPAPPFIAVKVATNMQDRSYMVTGIDPFGKDMPLPSDVIRSIGSPKKLSRAKSISFDVAGQALELRRARPVTCWAAIKKSSQTPEGKDDWFFARDVKLHDQGGRAKVGDEAANAPPLILRMRNVSWAGGSTNRPSLVLYVHKPDNPDRAESYAWTDPNAVRIGINLRWMQASCTIDGMEKPAKSTPQTINR